MLFRKNREEHGRTHVMLGSGSGSALTEDWKKKNKRLSSVASCTGDTLNYSQIIFSFLFLLNYLFIYFERKRESQEGSKPESSVGHLTD